MAKKETTKDRNGYLFIEDLEYLREMQAKTGISISSLIKMSINISKEKLNQLTEEHQKLLSSN